MAAISSGRVKTTWKYSTVQELRLAMFDPLRPRKRLALRTMPIAAAVIGDALMRTAVARLDMPAERSGAACGDRPHDAPLRIGQRRLVLSTIGCTVAAEDIRHFEPGSLHGGAGLEVLGRLGRFRWRQRTRQQIQRTTRGADLGSCQPQIPCRGRQTSMPHQQLDRAQVRAVLEQVAGKGVSQGVRRHRFGQSAAFGSQLAGIVDAVPRDVRTGDHAGKHPRRGSGRRDTNRAGSVRSCSESMT